MNYEKDSTIDPSALDVEWIEQPNLARKYGKHYAECVRTLAQAEESVKIIRSELIAEANTNPRKCCGKEKPNAADIEAYYRNSDLHKAAKTAWIDAEYELNMAEAAKTAITYGKKSALENLVKLHGQSYFAGPSVPRDLSKEWESKENQKSVDSKVKITRRK
jgi:hypothetical protein